jgi:chemotaxis protein MotA
MMANFILTPMMGKLSGHDAAETKVREMIIEGVLSIQQGDNPHILQMKLSSYLSPEAQRKLEELHPQS